MINQDNVEFIKDKFKDVVYLIEANSFEQHEIWRRWSKKLGYTQIGMGNGVVINSDLKNPIFVSYMPNYFAGSKILFFDPTSQLVDHKLVEEFNKAAFPQLFLKEGRHKLVDASNFHNCASDLKDYLKNDPIVQAQFKELRPSGCFEITQLDEIEELIKSSSNSKEIKFLLDEVRKRLNFIY